MTERIDTTPLGTWAPWPAAAWLLVAALATGLPCAAMATETSAAAASALKVLTAPLDGMQSSDTQSTNLGTNLGPNSASGMAQGGAVGASAHSGSHITVQRGESIDAVLRRGLPGMPLKDEFMRQALAKANPKIFPRGRTYPVKPGTVLALPSPEALRQQILAQAPQAAVLFQGASASQDNADTHNGPDKRRWVRFP